MRIKVCCIKSIEEAELACRAGAHLLGLVSESLSGSGAIPDELIREIAASVPDSHTTCLLTAETDPASVADRQRKTRTDAIQLVGSIRPEAVSELRSELPDVSLLKVIHVEGEQAIDFAASYADVERAISSVRPAGVDVCSGLRQNGKLDPGLLRAFLARATAAVA